MAVCLEDENEGFGVVVVDDAAGMLVMVDGPEPGGEGTVRVEVERAIVNVQRVCSEQIWLKGEGHLERVGCRAPELEDGALRNASALSVRANEMLECWSENACMMWTCLSSPGQPSPPRRLRSAV